MDSLEDGCSCNNRPEPAPRSGAQQVILTPPNWGRHGGESRLCRLEQPHCLDPWPCGASGQVSWGSPSEEGTMASGIKFLSKEILAG
jgi:hypothetical protein